ncbi:LexA family protein [Streptomyces olivaceus]|uniref:LexA family protein n=1 Tax=Streptomyces olivaceus TaxID=47716 RepID=UPI0037F4D214
MSLTERQVQILRCVRDAIAETGECPTLKEIGANVGLRSKSAVHYQLKRLEALGAITGSSEPLLRFRGRGPRGLSCAPDWPEFHSEPAAYWGLEA